MALEIECFFYAVKQQTVSFLLDYLKLIRNVNY